MERRLIVAVEKVKGDRRERHGDSARNMLLYLGQRRCGMKLKELAAESGLASYGAAAMAIKRYGNKLEYAAAEAAQMNNVIQMLNVKMWPCCVLWKQAGPRHPPRRLE